MNAISMDLKHYTCPYDGLTVVGFGLIGASFALAVKDIFPNLHIHAVDIDEAALQMALKRNWVDRVSLTLPTHFEDKHLLVLASPLTTLPDTFEALNRLTWNSSLTLMDVASCKTPVANCITRIWGQTPEKLSQFVLAHPMAGSQNSGAEHASALLFHGKPFLFCPLPETSLDRLSELVQLVQAIGALPHVLDHTLHDEAMATVSHVPQLVSVLAAQMVYQNRAGECLPLAGNGLGDLLRLAGSNYKMWEGVLLHNRETVVSRLHQLAIDLDNLIEELEHGHPEALAERFKQANEIAGFYQKILLNRQQQTLNFASSENITKLL
jgi:prephenate dehydrogenase